MNAQAMQTRLHIVFDSVIWYCYLALMFVASMLNQAFMSKPWLMMTVAVYLLLSLLALSASLGGRCNWAALRAARLPLLFLGLSIFYLWLQQALSVQTVVHQEWFSGADVPAWFDPRIAWSAVPDKTRMLALIEVLMFGVMLLSLALISNRRRLVQLLYTLTAVCCLHAVVGIFAKFAGVSLVNLDSIDGHYSAVRGWFVNRNHFAAFISLALVGALSLQFKLLLASNYRSIKSVFVEQVLSYRVLYLVFVLIAILALVLSESRSGFLAIFLSLILVTWFLGGASKQKFSRRRLIAPMLLIATITLFYFGSDLVQRFAVGSSFLGERGEQWSITWSLIRPQWLFGYGGNSYADVFQAYRGYSDLREVVYDQAHNDYLHIWLEQGLLGLFFWVAFLVLGVRSAVLESAKTSSTLINAVVMSGVIVIVAALLQSLVGFNLHIINIRFYFFAIMALIIASATCSQRKSTSVSAILV